MSFTLVTVTHNSGHVLPSFFDFLDLSHVPEGTRIVVVDSGSDNWKHVRRLSLQHGADFVAAMENIGYGAASNLGAAMAKSKWLAFVNPDVAVSIQTLAALVEVADSRGLAAIGPTILLPDGGTERNDRSLIVPPWRIGQRRALSPSRYLDDEVTLCGSVSGCCLIVRRDAFEQIGGFDSRFFMFAEEIDLQARLASRGGLIGMCRSIGVMSPGGGSSAGVTSRWANTQRFASHVLYVDKHFSRAEAIVDLLWRAIQIVVDDRYHPRLPSMLQLVREWRRGVVRAHR